MVVQWKRKDKNIDEEALMQQYICIITIMCLMCHMLIAKIMF